MLSPRPWVMEARRVVIGAVVLGAIGYALGSPATALLAGALAYLGWHLRQLYVLQQWLAHRKRRPMPKALGVWAPVLDSLERLNRQSRKRKRRLRSFISRFEQAAGAFPDAAVILDIDGGIVWLNQAANELLGLRYPQDLYQHVSNLVRNPDFVDYLERGNFEEPLEMPSPVEDGAFTLVRIVPYGSDRRLMLARDITRLNRLEQIRKDFVANVSHELRSPLTVIVGYLETFSDDERLPARWRRPLELMSRQANRMALIVEDLLKLSRIEHSPGEASTNAVAISDLLEGVRSDALGLGENTHRIHLESEKGMRLLGDYNELYSAFSNLVFNAIQYSPEGGDIWLRWKLVDDGAAVLEVEDTGIGVDEHHLPRLTERFYRVDKARSREVGGTGLGLAIVKHVLMRHDATLEVRSQLDVGSTFICRFPASRLEAIEPAEAGEEPAPAALEDASGSGD